MFCTWGLSIASSPGFRPAVAGVTLFAALAYQYKGPEEIIRDLIPHASMSVPEACAYHLQKDSTVEVQWKGARTIVTRDPVLAQQIFNDQAFHGKFFRSVHFRNSKHALTGVQTHQHRSIRDGVWLG